MDGTLQLLARRLVDWFEPDTHYAIALSGWVDSAVVAQAAAHSGKPAAVITARSSSVAAREMQDALTVGQHLTLPHHFIDTDEVDNPSYQRNDQRRCYYCKQQLFTAMRKRFPGSLILTGTNADDLSDYRPGLMAAREAGVRAPLAELGIDKSQVRELAKHWGLHLAEKPASPCLASRIAYGVPVTHERLSMVERAEDVLRELGLIEFRVRLHEGEIARLEVQEDALEQIVAPGVRVAITTQLSKLAFASSPSI